MIKFKDFRGIIIELSDSTWEHIHESHPEITLEVLEQVLLNPIEVRQNLRHGFVELFYQTKNHPKGKIRFRLVIIKRLKDGNYISSAMTTNSLKSGKTLFRKEME